MRSILTKRDAYGSQAEPRPRSTRDTHGARRTPSSRLLRDHDGSHARGAVWRSVAGCGLRPCPGRQGGTPDGGGCRRACGRQLAVFGHHGGPQRGCGGGGRQYVRWLVGRARFHGRHRVRHMEFHHEDVHGRRLRPGEHRNGRARPAPAGSRLGARPLALCSPARSGGIPAM